MLPPPPSLDRVKILSCGKAVLWDSISLCLAGSGWVTISYSKEIFVILYLVYGFAVSLVI